MSKQTELAQVADTITVDSGNVGIGTSSPSKKAHLYASNDLASLRLENTANSKVWDITPARPGVANTGLSIHNVTDDRIDLHVDNSGNVGIGEASPSTYGKLVVAGSTPFAVIRSTDTTTAGFSMLVNSGSNGVGSIGTDNGGHMTFDTGSTGAGQSERMRIDASGRVTMPYQPAFDVSYSSTGYTTSGTVVFNTVYTNVGGHYNTSNGRFTAPVSGSYIFYTSHIKDTNNTVSRRRFDKNSSQASNGRHLRLDDGQLYGDNGVLQAIIYCNAGDFVTVNQFAGTSYGSDNYDYFGGYLIG